MTNTREWPAGILCIALPCSGEAYAVRRPTSYQNLLTTATSLFRGRFDEAAEELYVKTNDFGLEWPVEILPDAWEMPEAHGFIRSVEVHTRMHGEGPSQLDFADADRTQATIPLSPSATPPRELPERALAHSTPANRRAQQTDDEFVSVGRRGHSEDEEVDEPEPKSSRNVRSRVSLQAHASNDNPRPIRTVRTEPTNEEIMPSSQEPDVTSGPKIHVQVQHEAESVTVKVRPQKTFASLFKTACNHFKLDKDTVKLFQMVAFDGRDSTSPIECSLSATLGENNIADDDVFFLLPYDSDD